MRGLQTNKENNMYTAIVITLFMMYGLEISCWSDSSEYHVPMYGVRSSGHNKAPELDLKALAAFVLLGYGSGVLCERLDPVCNPVLQIIYLYLWGRVEISCVEHALNELRQQGVVTSSAMTEYSFWVASWLGYFTSLANRRA